MFAIRRWRPVWHGLVLGALVALAGLVAFSVAGAAEAEAKKKRGNNKIRVMSRNVYLGADLGPAIGAPDIPSAISGAGEIVREVERTDFRERAVPLAREIKRARPHLVGLQEVALWQRQEPSDGGGTIGGQPPVVPGATDATEVRFDFLKLLRDELTRIGAPYRLVAVQDEFEGELPADADGNPGTGTGPLAALGADLDQRLTMRDVILARRGAGVKTRRVRMSHYDTRFEADISGVTVPSDRGWISVEARRKGRKFRFVNTHLEAFGDPAIREAQAKELRGEALRTRKRGRRGKRKQVILVGDLNSGLAGKHRVFGDDQLAFRVLKRFKMRDRGAVQSCCYPSALNDPSFTFDHTVDHVMVKPGLRRVKRQTFVTGNDPDEMTPSGLWPSDHGGVVSTLKLRKRR